MDAIDYRYIVQYSALILGLTGNESTSGRVIHRHRHRRVTQVIKHLRLTFRLEPDLVLLFTKTVMGMALRRLERYGD